MSKNEEPGVWDFDQVAITGDDADTSYLSDIAGDEKGEGDDDAPKEQQANEKATKTTTPKSKRTSTENSKLGSAKKKPKSDASKSKKNKSGQADTEATKRSVTIVDLPDYIYKALDKGRIKNASMSNRIKEILREFLSDPDWFKEFKHAIKHEDFRFARSDEPRKMSPQIGVYSKSLKQVVEQLSGFGLSNNFVVLVMLDLQIKKGLPDATKDIKFDGAVSI